MHSPKILPQHQLSHSPSIVHFPNISNHQKETCLLKQQQFWPVMKTKRYNLLKLHELKHHYERDRRLGRLSYEKDRISKITEQQEQQLYNSINYHVQRQHRNRKMYNSSFINLLEQIKHNNRYFSIQR